MITQFTMYVHRGLIANKIIYVSVFDSSFLYNYVANHTFTNKPAYGPILYQFSYLLIKSRSHSALERIIRTIDHGAVDI